MYKVIFTKQSFRSWNVEFIAKIYYYVIICSFEIGVICLQNWNISYSDTLKPKNILTIDISKP